MQATSTRLAWIVPKLRQQLLATEHLLRVLHEETQQLERTWLEGGWPIAAPGGVRGRVKEQLSGSDRRDQRSGQTARAEQ
jgi:hypothetical protein